MEIYILRPGDSAEGLERRFALERGALAAYNGLHGAERFVPGMTLGIPGTLRPGEKAGELWCFGSGRGGAFAQASFMVLPGPELGREEPVIPENFTALARADEVGALPLLLLEARERSELRRLFACGESFFSRLSEEGWGGVLISALPRFDFEKAETERFLAAAAKKLHERGLICACMEQSAEALPGREHCDRVLRRPEGLCAGERDVLMLGPAARDLRQDGLRRDMSLSAAWELASALGAKLCRGQDGTYFDYRDPEGLSHRVYVRDLNALSAMLKARVGPERYGLRQPWELSEAELKLLLERFEPDKFL